MQSGVLPERNILLALGWYYPEMHRGVARYARDHHWHITFDFDDPVPENWKGDGVLTSLGARQDLWHAISQFKGPVIDLTESRSEISLPRVTMDNWKIGQLAAQYFLNRGYRHFTFVHRWDLGVSRRRHEAYRDELAKAGYDCEVLCWQRALGTRPDTREQRILWLSQQLQHLPKPLAVWGTRDIDAAEVIEACMMIGIAIPEQVAVLGVDNTESICDCMRIPLSSIDNNLELVGYEGAALLDRMMSGEQVGNHPRYIPPVGIIERRSTDHLAVDHPQVSAALRIIHQEFDQPMTMRDILARIPISRSGLEKAFREHYVRAPMEELRRVRFSNAQKLLTETPEKIATIARRTGFETSHNLCRSFKQEFGLTPREYREQFAK
jgi:LacI family transcriptional regulator